MREIKFRAWNGRSMEYGGFSVHASQGDVIPDPIGLVTESSPLMQYAGLKDSKGVDIYEGDIVYLAGFGSCLIEFPFLKLYAASGDNDIGEIVGNVYENPDMVTQ